VLWSGDQRSPPPAIGLKTSPRSSSVSPLVLARRTAPLASPGDLQSTTPSAKHFRAFALNNETLSNGDSSYLPSRRRYKRVILPYKHKDRTRKTGGGGGWGVSLGFKFPRSIFSDWRDGGNPAAPILTEYELIRERSGRSSALKQNDGGNNTHSKEIFSFPRPAKKKDNYLASLDIDCRRPGARKPYATLALLP